MFNCANNIDNPLGANSNGQMVRMVKQIGQTHLNNSSATVDQLFECV